MNRLWAPWRMHYIKHGAGKGCIFCKVKKERKDASNFIVYRSRFCFAILNTFPYNNGHIMVVTNRHIDSLQKLTADEMLDLMDTTRKMITALKTALHPGGFNVGMNIGKESGAGIAGHLHMHIVPRWIGDTNFLPVVGNTKVISQSLKSLYRSLIECLREKK